MKARTPDTDLATARAIRSELVRMSYRAGAPHLAPALSCVDILVALYWHALKIDPEHPASENRDRFILSKGHAASALYATLAYRGFFQISELEQFGQHGGRLAEQPIPFAVPGVEAATGSLGHGLSLGLGMALAARVRGHSYRTVVLVGDGECNEGSVWEAAMLAPALRLDSLCCIVDFNGWQGTGRSREIAALDPLAQKWAAFGWHALEVDGHNISALTRAINTPRNDRPLAVIAHTIKGKGVSFMQDDNNWHYRIPDHDDLQRALEELAA